MASSSRSALRHLTPTVCAVLCTTSEGMAWRPHSCFERRHKSSGRLTALLELRPRGQPPMSPGPPTEEAIERLAPLATPNTREDPDTNDATPLDNRSSFIETTRERDLRVRRRSA